MTHTEPLLFVNGPPPVFAERLPIEEESTSVFVMDDGVSLETVPARAPRPAAAAAVDPAIKAVLTYLGGPFQRQVYKPLQFVVDGETIDGAIRKIEDDMVYIESGDLQTMIAADEIENILWRGAPFEK